MERGDASQRKNFANDPATVLLDFAPDARVTGCNWHSLLLNMQRLQNGRAINIVLLFLTMCVCMRAFALTRIDMPHAASAAASYARAVSTDMQHAGAEPACAEHGAASAACAGQPTDSSCRIHCEQFSLDGLLPTLGVESYDGRERHGPETLPIPSGITLPADHRPPIA